MTSRNNVDTYEQILRQNPDSMGTVQIVSSVVKGGGAFIDLAIRFGGVFCRAGELRYRLKLYIPDELENFIDLFVYLADVRSPCIFIIY